ncbi:DUF805 domain-containing protein [Kiloniella litopenaei]|uniref:DUF805 domain-containing protein n=1 Tax=Kiloniella litopenaei TaxID=1549748 RepID=UPI0006990735|nr:DUF805 domain-containing protein [Kiloniella litopenaei]
MENPVIKQPFITSGHQVFSWLWFLFSPKGRISSFDYWFIYFMPLIALCIVFISVYIHIGTYIPGILKDLFLGIFALGTLIPSILIHVKRWHDRDKSGWWTLIIFVPIIGAFWVFIECSFLSGTAGPNRFGPSRFPEEQNINEVFE